MMSNNKGPDLQNHLDSFKQGNVLIATVGRANQDGCAGIKMFDGSVRASLVNCE